jgi:hypothetical protein
MKEVGLDDKLHLAWIIVCILMSSLKKGIALRSSKEVGGYWRIYFPWGSSLALKSAYPHVRVTRSINNIAKIGVNPNMF